MKNINYMDIFVFLGVEGPKSLKRSEIRPLTYHQTFLDQNYRILPTTWTIFAILSKIFGQVF